MNIKISAVILTACLLFLSGCGVVGNGGGDTSLTVSPTAPPLLTVDIGEMLTADQVGDALGSEVGQAEVYESSTIARYTAVDGGFVELLIEDASRTDFDDMLDELEIPPVDTPNLGDVSKWVSDTDGIGYLFCYGKNRMIQLTVSDSSLSDGQRLTCARQLAAIILEKM